MEQDIFSKADVLYKFLNKRWNPDTSIGSLTYESIFEIVLAIQPFLLKEKADSLFNFLVHRYPPSTTIGDLNFADAMRFVEAMNKE